MLDSRQCLAHGSAVCRQVVAQLDLANRLAGNVQRVIGLGCELVRCGLELGGVGHHEFAVGVRLVLDGPGAAHVQAVGFFLGQVEYLDRVHAVAADEGHVQADLASLDHDGRAFGQQCRQHDGIGVAGLDLGELGLEVHIALGEGFGRRDRNLQVFQRFLEVVVAALGEHVVVAIHHGDLLDAGFLHRHLDGLGQHVGFGDRIAEHIVTDGRDAVGRVGSAKGNGLGSLSDGVGRLRGI